MIEPRSEIKTATDGYAFHLLRWEPVVPIRGRVVILHGVQSHGGWYLNLGRVLAERGYEAVFPDRRGSGRNTVDRGHTDSYQRLVDDVIETLADHRDGRPLALAGISWGGKLAVIAAARRPDLVDALALICPGLHPRIDVSRAERFRIAWAFFTNRRKHFPIPLADPALFTDSPEGQAFIAADTLGLRTASASLLAASRFIDAQVRAVRGKIRQPSLLILGGRDRIVDNARTGAYFAGIGTKASRIIDYPEGGHTLEFESNPNQYGEDLADWLDSTLRA